MFTPNDASKACVDLGPLTQYLRPTATKRKMKGDQAF